MQLEVLKVTYPGAKGLFDEQGNCSKQFGHFWERGLLNRHGFSLRVPTSKNHEICDPDTLADVLSNFHAQQIALQKYGKHVSKFGSVSPILTYNRDQSPIVLSYEAKLLDDNGKDYIYELGDKSTDSKYRDCRLLIYLSSSFFPRLSIIYIYIYIYIIYISYSIYIDIYTYIYIMI